MASESDDKPASNGAEAGATGQALLVRGESAEESGEAATEVDARLERLRMQIDVMVKVRSFRVEDLLALEPGSVVETIHEHSQDVPLWCGGALLAWGEFEVVEQRLAVRMTRLG